MGGRNKSKNEFGLNFNRRSNANRRRTDFDRVLTQKKQPQQPGNPRNYRNNIMTWLKGDIFI